MNKTNDFEPRDHLITLERANRKTGIVTKTEYLQVQWRVAWFRNENPNGKIISKPVHIDVDKGVAIFETFIETESGATAQAHGSETIADWKDFLEKAESKAVGRALALLGYGTQFAGPELDEGTERIVDAPVSTMPLRGTPSVEQNQAPVVVKAPEVKQEPPLGAQFAREEISKLFGPLMQAGIYDNSDEGKKLYLRHVAKWIRLKQAADLFNAITPTQLEYVKACVAEELRKVAA